MIIRDADSKARLKEWCINTPTCLLCGKPPQRGTRLEFHHAFLKVGGAGSDLTLGGAALHRMCHFETEASAEGEQRVRELIAKREGTTVEAIFAALWFIRRTDRHASAERIAAQMRDLSDEVRRLVTGCLNEAGIR